MVELFRYIVHSFVRVTAEDKSIHVGDDSIRPPDSFNQTILGPERQYRRQVTCSLRNLISECWSRKV